MASQLSKVEPDRELLATDFCGERASNAFLLFFRQPILLLGIMHKERMKKHVGDDAYRPCSCEWLH